MLAATVAYQHGEQWLDELLHALRSNVQLLTTLLAEHLPEVTFTAPDAGYLVWLDCRALRLGDDPTPAFLEQGVALNPGPDFGPTGAGHVRLNLARSPEVLREAVVRMAAALPRRTCSAVSAPGVRSSGSPVAVSSQT